MRKNLYLYWQNLHNMTLFITIDKIKFHEWYEPEVMRNYSVSVELSPTSACVWWWLWVVIVLSTTFSLSVSTGVSGCFVQKKYFISLHGLILILLRRLASPTVTNLSDKFWIASCQKIAEIRIVAFNWKSSHTFSESLANKNETILW